MKSTSRWLPENLHPFYFLLNFRSISVISLLFAAILIPLGLAAYVNNTSLSEVKLEYTECRNAPLILTAPTPPRDNILRWSYDPVSLNCTIEFTVPNSLKTKVFLYIRITNFYQNSKFYLKSKDPDQLNGKVYQKASEIPTLLTSCGYLQYANCDEAGGFLWSLGNGLSFQANNPDCQVTPPSPVIKNSDRQAQYFPLVFLTDEDDISDLTCVGNGCTANDKYSFSQSGIAWPEDASLYRKSGWAEANNLPSVPTKIIPPPHWREAWPQIYGNGYHANGSNIPDFSKWERFQVWLRVSGLPHFRKLWGRQTQTLSQGTYTIVVTNTWNAAQFGGTKALVISEVGFLGPRNQFLAIELLAVGIFCLLTAISVLTIKIRKYGDSDLLSWNKVK